MKILLVHQYFLEDEDGGGSRWNEMTRFWTQAGHQITVLAGMTHYMGHQLHGYSGHYFVEKLNRDGIRVIRCRVTRARRPGFAGRLFGYLSFAVLSTFAGFFYAREKYDLIIVSSPPLFTGITALLLSRAKEVPFLFEVRDLWPESAIETGVLSNPFFIKWAYWFEKMIYKKAKLITVLTPAFREILKSKKGVKPEKIIFIPNAADFDMAERVKATFDCSTFRKENNLENQFVITYVGAHGIANDLTQILDTAELLLNTPVCFLLIGDGPKKAELMAKAKKRKLKNVRFIDFMEKTRVFEYILASDMGTSVLKKAEIFKTIYSNKTFDYFSCQKPVLMAIDGVSRKLIEDADAGIFVEPENPEDFADKIRCCMKDKARIIQQGQNGYIYAKKHFDRKNLAQTFLEEILKMRDENSNRI